MLIAFHKPYGVLSQFTPEPGSTWQTLAEFGLPPRVYPLGRLDADSEGLLLLSDEPGLNDLLLNPRHAHRRLYWALVERTPGDDALARLSAGGLSIGGHVTLPCEAQRIEPPPTVADRVPPVRYRKNVTDCWISLALREGKNRQVRRMTAAVGHPTLRLIRMAIGAFPLGNLPVGQWRPLDSDERQLAFGALPTP